MSKLKAMELGARSSHNLIWSHTPRVYFFVFWLKSSRVYTCRMLGKCKLNRMHPIVRCTCKAGAEHDVHSRLHLGGGEGGADDTVTSGEGHNMTPPCLPGYSCAGKALQFHLLVFRWEQNPHYLWDQKFGKADPVHSVDDWHIHWLTITAALKCRNE